MLPGEIMKVFVLKEGKEYNQGVAYLDDGTMVVVDNARKMISKTIDIVVTSVLQTTAGKMIFGRYIEPGARRSAPGVSAPQPTRHVAVGRAAAPIVAKDDRRRPEPGSLRPDLSFHWLRTVFWLIPAIAVYTIVLGIASIGSSLFDRRGYFAHGCARAWSWLILATTGVEVTVRASSALSPEDLRLRREPPEHLRHPVPVLVDAVSAAHHREGIARQFSGARVASAAHRAHAGRPQATRIARGILGWANRLTRTACR